MAATEPTPERQELKVRSLKKSYGSYLAVADISLDVATGEIIGLLGPNGAGKTTSFYMIVGLIRPDAGSIVLDDRDLTALPMHGRARAGIGYLPQEASVFRRLTVEENVRAILELQKHLSRDQRKAREAELLEEFGLTKLRRQRGERLSGGERRRLEIARALASEPLFMLLDEPFAGVDPISVQDIKEQIRDLANRGIGVLITDHSVRDTLEICDRAYIVNQGNIIANGDSEAILNNETVRSVYLGDQFTL
ncbi:MAG: LPS export ABC transporter ATP-binding protein [Pseudomonadota bacterium]